MQSGERNKLGRLALVLAVGGLLLSSSAFAEEQQMTVTEKFAAMDTNHDGKISPDEYAVYTRIMFDKMDTNKDGQLTVVEIQAAHPGKAKGMSVSEKVKMVDTNRDGTVSVEEYTAGGKTVFEKMDSDGDGYVTITEMEAGHKKMMEKK